ARDISAISVRLRAPLCLCALCVELPLRFPQWHSIKAPAIFSAGTPMESYPCAFSRNNSHRITSLCKKPGVQGAAAHVESHFVLRFGARFDIAGGGGRKHFLLRKLSRMNTYTKTGRGGMPLDRCFCVQAWPTTRGRSRRAEPWSLGCQRVFAAALRSANPIWGHRQKFALRAASPHGQFPAGCRPSDA